MQVTTRSLSVELINGVRIRIPLLFRVMVLTGKSALGKSYLCHLLKMAKRMQMVKESSVSLHKIQIWNHEDDVRYDISDSIIFIDRYPTLVSPELIKFILNSENIFILITQEIGLDFDIPAQALYLLDFNDETKEFSFKMYAYRNRYEGKL